VHLENETVKGKPITAILHLKRLTNLYQGPLRYVGVYAETDLGTNPAEGESC
jgi:hypothetical protein